MDKQKEEEELQLALALSLSETENRSTYRVKADNFMEKKKETKKQKRGFD